MGFDPGTTRDATEPVWPNAAAAAMLAAHNTAANLPPAYRTHPPRHPLPGVKHSIEGPSSATIPFSRPRVMA
ncbi:hypothetical protein GCM10011404_26280 [Sphingomonas prati]|nr:hypothetical protein GCM10011404_26280 [Sphingomonas prati]